MDYQKFGKPSTKKDEGVDETIDDLENLFDGEVGEVETPDSNDENENVETSEEKSTPPQIENTRVSNTERVARVRVKVNALKIRRVGSLNAMVKGVVTKGNILNVVSGTLNDEWIEVEFKKGKFGFAMATYLEEVK